jgi:hypothetical protein
MLSVPRCCNQRKQSDVRQFCTGGREYRTCAREAEDSPLLEAFTRERLVKTQQAGKVLAGSVVICQWWRLSVGLQLLVLTI